MHRNPSAVRLGHCCAPLWTTGSTWRSVAAARPIFRAAAEGDSTWPPTGWVRASPPRLCAPISSTQLTGKVPWPRLWRTISWAGAVLLLLYGGANTAISNAVLTGLIRPEDGYDRLAMMGHAWLWDPLFLLWGVVLLGHLYPNPTSGIHELR